MPKMLNQKRFIKLLDSMEFDLPSDPGDFLTRNGKTYYSGKQKVVLNFLASNSYSEPAINAVLQMKDPHFNICVLSAPYLDPESFRKVVDILDKVHFFSVINRAGRLQAAHFEHLTEAEPLRRALYSAINLGILSSEPAEKSAFMVLITPMLLFMDSTKVSANREIQTISRFLQQKEAHVR